MTLADNREYEAELIGRDEMTDIALLRIDADELPTMPWGDSSLLRIAEWVLAVGNPFQLNQTVTLGIVSAVGRDNLGVARYEDFIQTDAAINPGNSGGALINASGELVGINTAIITTSGSSAGIGFAVPSDQIQPVVQRILQKDRIENGVRPNMGWLGISVVTQSIAVPTASNAGDNTTYVQPLVRCKNWIESVEPNSPAEAAELAPLVIKDGVVMYGDAIVAVGGNEVSDFEELRAQLEKCVVGEQVALTVQDAEDKKRVVYATLSRKPTI